MPIAVREPEKTHKPSTLAAVSGMAGQSLANVVSTPMKNQDNDLYVMQQKARKYSALAVAPVAMFYHSKASQQHLTTNISGVSEQYLKEIGFQKEYTKNTTKQEQLDIFKGDLRRKSEANLKDKLGEDLFSKYNPADPKTRKNSLDSIEKELTTQYRNAALANNDKLKEDIMKKISSVRDTKNALGAKITMSGTSASSAPQLSKMDKKMMSAKRYSIKTLRNEILGNDVGRGLNTIEAGARLAKKSVDFAVNLNYKIIRGSVNSQIAVLQKKIFNQNLTAKERYILNTRISRLKNQQAKIQISEQRYNRISKFLEGKRAPKIKKVDIVNTKKVSKQAEKAAERKLQRQVTKNAKKELLKKQKRVEKKIRKIKKTSRARYLNKKREFDALKAAQKQAADAAFKKNRRKDLFDLWRKKIAAAWKGSSSAAASAAAASSKKGVGELVKKIFGKKGLIVVGVIAGVVCLFLLLAMFGGTLGGGPATVIALHFLSADIATDFTGKLDNVNYCQAIANLMTYDLAGDLAVIQETAAYDEVANRAYLGRYGIPAQPRLTKRDSVASSVWEEVDNQTKWLDKNNRPIPERTLYADTYIANEADRNTVTIYDNIVPIMNMMHMKMQDEIDYDSWHEALAYCYYMYAMSHDTNRFDYGTNTADFEYLTDEEGNYTGFKLRKVDCGSGKQTVWYHGNNGDGKLAFTVRHAAASSAISTYTDLASATSALQKMSISEFDGQAQINYKEGSNVLHSAVSRNMNGSMPHCANEFFHDGENGGAYSAECTYNLFRLRQLYADAYGGSDPFNPSGNNNTLTNRSLAMKMEALIRTVNTTYNAPGANMTPDAAMKQLGFVKTNSDYPENDARNYEIYAHTGNHHYSWEGIISSADTGNLETMPDGSKVIFSGMEDGGFSRIAADANTERSVRVFASHEQENYGGNSKLCDHCALIGGDPDDIFQKNADGTYRTDPVWDKKYLNGDDFIWNFEEKGEDDAALNAFRTAHQDEINSGALIVIDNGQDYANYQNEMGVWLSPDGYKAGKFAWTYCGHYVCFGHCGGHIYPTADMIEMMTYEGLAQLDGFKTTHFESLSSILGPAAVDGIAAQIGLSDQYDRYTKAIEENKFDTINEIEIQTILNLTEPLINTSTIETSKRTYLRKRYLSSTQAGSKESKYEHISLTEWRVYWSDQAKGWFSLFPSSPKGLLQNISKTFIYNAAGIVDAVTDKIQTAARWAFRKVLGDDSEKKRQDEDYYIDEKNELEDVFEFTGWFTEDGMDYDENAMDELDSFYGSFYDDCFETSLDLWDSFDVIFDERYIKLKDKEVKVPAGYKP